MEGDPTVSKLSSLGDELEGKDGKFHFKLIWPRRDELNANEWKQSSERDL